MKERRMMPSDPEQDEYQVFINLEIMLANRELFTEALNISDEEWLVVEQERAVLRDKYFPKIEPSPFTDPTRI